MIAEVYAEYNLEMPEEVSEVVANFDEVSEDSKVSMLMGFVLVALILVFGGVLPFIFRKKRYGIYGNNDTPYTHNTPTFFGGFGGSSGSGGGFSGGGGSASGGGASRGF